MSSTQLRAGITNVTRGPADLIEPNESGYSGLYRYGPAYPFQIGPTQVALSTCLRMEGLAAGDFENGSDMIVFDDLSKVSADHAIPFSRNDKYLTPVGQPRIAIRYPAVGGFVPHGALRADGSPHPYAGTGFTFAQILDFPMLPGGIYTKADKKSRMIGKIEVRQIRFDGKHLTTDFCETFAKEHPLIPPGQSNWALFWTGQRPAIPDGDDLLLPIGAAQGDRSTWMPSPMACGVARFTYQHGEWRPATFVPVIVNEDPFSEVHMEPSLVRDVDGSLLFCARGCFNDHVEHAIQIWRSRDGGTTWKLVIDDANTRGQSTVNLNVAVDGTPYVVANAFGRERDELRVWPLNTERNALAESILVRDALEEFGPTPSGAVWFMDHPCGAVVRLADGKWRSLLVYRIMDRGEHGGSMPAPQTGVYIEEIESTGAAIPAWHFAE